MPLDERNTAYLWDMLQAAREARSYLARVSEARFLRDQMRQRALERAIEILGEAAGRVSKPARQELVQIDWRRIVGQRNVLAHKYSKIDYALLYHTTRDNVPRLIGTLEKLLEERGPR
jgi:uncharacterized protein with HEPN domain